MIKLSALIVLLLVSTLHARADKGQKIYMNTCKECHKNGQAMCKSQNMREWKKVMSDNGQKLVTIHTSSKKAQASWLYFKSAGFSKDSKHLRDFLTTYAKDSGNIPACD
jgi:hypothetical protein